MPPENQYIESTQIFPRTLNEKRPSNLVRGMPLYPMTLEVLVFLENNENFVIPIAEETSPNLPAYYIRPCDFVDFIWLKRAGLVEAFKPFDISSEDFVKEVKEVKEVENSKQRGNQDDSSKKNASSSYS